MHHRRLLVMTVLVGLVAALLLVAGAASARDGKSGFEIVVYPQGDVLIDQGWAFQDLMESLDGEALGWDGGTCVSVDPDPAVDDMYMCEMVFDFPDGDVVAAGAFSITEYIEGDSVFAVTGGSGAFRYVRGEVLVIPTADFSSAQVIFRVTGNTVRY